MERGGVPALTRAMRIVDLLAQSGQAGLTVADIATATGIAKSTTALLCTVLEEEGMARRFDGRYRLGRRFLSLAGDYLATVDQLDEFYDACRRLPIVALEAARVALLEGTDVIYLARYQGGHPLRLTGQVGDRFPASVTATGKAILSTMGDDVVDDRFRGRALPRFTERSIQSLPELMRDLAVCRERGYAMDDEETNLGLVCYSIPVPSTGGQPAKLAVSTTMSKARSQEVQADEVVAELRELAAVFHNPLEGRAF